MFYNPWINRVQPIDADDKIIKVIPETLGHKLIVTDVGEDGTIIRDTLEILAWAVISGEFEAGPKHEEDVPGIAVAAVTIFGTLWGEIVLPDGSVRDGDGVHYASEDAYFDEQDKRRAAREKYQPPQET